MNKLYKLKDLIRINNGKDYKHLKDGVVPVYGSGGLMTHVSEALYTGESLLLPRKGTLDNIMYVNGSFWTVDTMYWSVVNTELAYPKYLYYYLSLLNLSCRDSGSTLPSMTFDAYYSLDISLPSLEIQKRIADKMYTLDSKIENNNAIISELESLAKDIYDYWFTQFDFPDENGNPYKSSGGKMVWNEELKREIPEGWEVRSLFDGMDVVYGFPLSTEYFNDKSGIPVIRIRDILDNTSSAYTTENVPNYALSKNKDLLIGMDGNFHMNFCAQDDYIINQRITRIRNKANISVLQVYFEIMPYIKAKEQNVARSTVGHLSDKDLKSLRIMDSHNSNIFIVFESILDKYCMLINENSELTSLRDFLLPLLMNGQVTVSADEK